MKKASVAKVKRFTTSQKKAIREMTLSQLTTIIVLMEIEREPRYGFTLGQIYRELSTDYSGSKSDLLRKLNIFRARNPRCFTRGKYLGTPRKLF